MNITMTRNQMIAKCNKCNNETQFNYGDDEPNKFGDRCIVCSGCREFINVNDLLSPIIDDLVIKEDIITEFLDWLESNSENSIDREWVEEYLTYSTNGK